MGNEKSLGFKNIDIKKEKKSILKANFSRLGG